jgi:hypothetical protein
MINWGAVRFVDCVLCEEECAPFNEHESSRSVCGYCMWRFSLKWKYADEPTGEEKDAAFAGWLAKELALLAKAQAAGGTRRRSWRGRRQRAACLSDAATRAAETKREHRARKRSAT